MKNNQPGINPARGGKRAGAGRPKGSPNKASLARQAQIEASGLTPLEYMLSILRNEQNDTAQRFEAAKHAAPYVHPKLSSVEASLTADVNAVISEIQLTGPEG